MEENNIDEEGVRFSRLRNNVRRKLFQDDTDDACNREKCKEQILEETRRQSEQVRQMIFFFLNKFLSSHCDQKYLLPQFILYLGK